MKRLFVGGLSVVLAFGLCACGGSTPTTPTPPATTQPPPPPAPTFPNMIANWTGTLTIVVSTGGVSLSNTCAHAVTITTQTAGSFSGTFTLSGGSVTSCAGAGTVTGTVGTDARISGLAYGVTLGASGCTRLAGDGLFNGQLANNSISATTTDTVTCGTVTAARNLTVAIAR